MLYESISVNEHKGKTVWANEGATLIYDYDTIMGQHCIPMQSTGLRDRAGKLIFEGDVVRMSNPRNMIQSALVRGVVVFNFFSWGVQIKAVDVWERYAVPPPEIDSISYFINSTEKNIEIIGTIYENPELLKG
jgi:uncharacterized phage protein (TIGR01671 family)